MAGAAEPGARVTSPLVQLRPRSTLFHVEGGWFSANWHFSFDHYVDPQNTSWGSLRVFNDDRLEPGAAWPMHPHRDVEGITYVAEGVFEHADSRGNGGVLHPGSVQRVTLGSGMMHSERNHSPSEPMRFIQMWIIPAERGLAPSVEQRAFSEADRKNVLVPLLVPAPGYGEMPLGGQVRPVTVHQDAALFATLLDPGRTVSHAFAPGRGGYVFAVHGEATLQAPDARGGEIDEGGAAKVARTERITLSAGPRGAEVLLVDVRTS